MENWEKFDKVVESWIGMQRFLADLGFDWDLCSGWIGFGWKLRGLSEDFNN